MIPARKLMKSVNASVFLSKKRKQILRDFNAVDSKAADKQDFNQELVVAVSLFSPEKMEVVGKVSKAVAVDALLRNDVAVNKVAGLVTRVETDFSLEKINKLMKKKFNAVYKKPRLNFRAVVPTKARL